MKKRTILIVFLLLFAALLRFYRIQELTEFLGDQGRTGIIIWNAWTNKTLPLVGPPVLSGQYLGPFFYYFIAFPFILSNFDPLAPAIWIALFGILSVYLVFYLGEKLCNFWIGLGVASLYAASPYIIGSDRTLWEPNIIPFFVLLYILCLYLVRNERKFAAFFPMGILVGILVQLHYPNVFFIALSALFLVYTFITRRKQESLASIIFWILAGIAGFIAMLTPFLYHEWQNNWKDLKEILLIFFPSGSPLSKRLFLRSFLDFSSRGFYKLIPITKSPVIIFMQIIILGSVLARKRFWEIFLSLWFIAGIAAISLYKGIVFDHYFNFLLPVPFFLFGLVIFAYKRFIPSIFWIALIGLGIFLQLRSIDNNEQGLNDITRTRGVSGEMMRLSSGKSFSFTLISSRSFSDLHYRYFFTINNVRPVPVEDTAYQQLFLVCEKAPCISIENIEAVFSVPILCHEEHCGGSYPKIDLTAWRLIQTEDFLDSRMYIYRRKLYN